MQPLAGSFDTFCKENEPMSDIQHHEGNSELARLRAEFPHWSFGIHWQAAASGPDARTVFATLGDLVVSDLTAEGLARQLRERERG
jgi:hypothetical protein